MVVTLQPIKGSGTEQDPSSVLSTLDNVIPGNAQKTCALAHQAHLQKSLSNRVPSVASSLSSEPQEAQAWVFGYFDHSGKFFAKSSSLLEPRLSEVFSPGFHRRLAMIIAEADPSIYIDPAAYGCGKTEVESSPVKLSTADCNVSEHVTNKKRDLSKKSVLAKRKKSSIPTTLERENKGMSLEEEADETDEDNEFVDASYEPVSVRIGDTAQIEKIIDIRLRQMKQVNCKLVAKSWIKAKEPTKQTNYPYNGGPLKEEASSIFGDANPGELTKPDWWPSTDNWPRKGCRHKEPDHLRKDERLILLKHMLKICDVAILKTSAEEVYSRMDDHAIPHLKEIYRLREKQERFLRGEMDGGTTILVEKLPSVNRSGPKFAKGSKKRPAKAMVPSRTSATAQNNIKRVRRVGVAPDSRAQQREAKTTDDGQSQSLKAEHQEIYHSSNDIQHTHLRNSSCRNRRAIDCQQTTPSEQISYLDTEPAQSNLASSSASLVDIRSLNSCLDAYSTSCGKSTELPQNHGLPQELTWDELGGSLPHNQHADGGHGANFSTQGVPFFNEGYAFNDISATNPYQSSLDTQFAGPLDVGEYGLCWPSDYALPYRS